MIISTTEHIPSKETIEIIEITRDSKVKERNIGGNIFAGLKNSIGRKIEEYTKLQA